MQNFIHDIPVVNNLSYFGINSDKYLTKTCRKLEKYILVQLDGSWLWTGTVHYGGYGITGLYQVTSKVQKTLVVHRLLYHLLKEVIPEAMVLLHIDDNKLSIHPDNLRIGTQLENIQDVCDKGRVYTVFSKEDVLIITELYNTGDWTQEQLSIKYNCCASAISNLLLGKTLPHIYRKTFRTYYIDENKKSRGESTNGAKATNEIVLEIRAKYALGGYTFGGLGREYNLDGQTVSNIVHRKSWKHI
jgi:hypothetical protein